MRRQFEASIKAATARDRITNLFGQHVSPQVVERLMSEGTKTDSDIRRVAVMFVDFRSFTAGARTRTPQEVVNRLDGAFAILVDILDRHGGIVVDATMHTSDPDIFAVGECVEHNGTIYGLVAPLFEQGKVLAATLTGNAAYRSENVDMCCCTSSVVGTRIATCLPSCTALNAARTAISVLP